MDEIRARKGQVVAEPDYHGERFLPNHRAKYMYLLNSNLTDADMVHLVYLTHLGETDVPRSITDAGFEFLGQTRSRPTLEKLDVFFTSLTDAGLPHIGRLTALKELLFCENQISDEGLQHLATLERLEKLSFHTTGVTGAGLAHLAPLQNLKSLTIAYYSHDKRGNYVPPSPEAIAAALAGLDHLPALKNLKRLSLSGDLYTDDAVAHLAQLRGLESLELRSTRISGDALQQLREALPGCSISK